MDFNNDWIFHKGDLSEGASVKLQEKQDRESVRLPHDWAISGPFSKKYNARCGGLPVYGVSWYRKHFKLSKQDQQMYIFIDFEGVMMNAEVWINGHYLGIHHNGYTGLNTI
ncbi:sugar-binding domain-containing protein [Persicobacter psychrovividus]|uniref:sugar-binding domain-containing protein n=1 Tax=Persicobacter psychrovividus TaxID=387638 RepID=UPI0030CA3D9A